MGLFHFEENSNYRFGIWKMDESEEELSNILGNEIVVPFKTSGKRIEFLSVRALAILMDINPLSISHEPSGKPYLTGNETTISISHTKGYAAIMLSNLQHIGADIEHKSERVLKVRKKFMSDQEEDALSVLTGDELISLLLHWSAKEALFKAIPDEGVDFIRELQITDFNCLNNKGFFRARALRSGMDFQIDYLVEKDFVFTACFPV